MQDIPYGYCHCGCGQKTNLVQWSNAHHGWKRGEPKRYIQGHQRRGKTKPDRYRIEDRGFESPCWTWLLSKVPAGYGQVRISSSTIPAHRYYYEKMRGPIPDGFQLDHLCRNRDCVNPEHLEVVTHAENVRRGKSTPFTHEDIEMIRRSSTSGVELARRFGVRPDTIYAIRAGRSWA
jgi:hypothetical protein